MGCSSSRSVQIQPELDPIDSLRQKFEARLSAVVPTEDTVDETPGKNPSPSVRYIDSAPLNPGVDAECMDPANTILIFDWDDTLCPTSWVRTKVSDGDGGRMRHPGVQYKEDLQGLADVVVDLLTKAQDLGKVVIVTNASRGWVDHTCAKLMPKARSVLKRIPIFYAQEHLTAVEKANWPAQKLQTEAKVRAMRAAASEFYSQETWKNVLSVGDAIYERDAVRKVVETRPCKRHRTKCRTKSVKMVEKPSLESMGLQLALASDWLTRVVQADQDLDINFGA